MRRFLNTFGDQTPFPKRTAPAPPLTCLLTPLPGGKALSLALVHCLSEEIRDVRFTLDPHGPVDAVWVCGYGERAARFLPKLRALHPDAMIVVTGRDPAAAWSSTILDAGADFACSWPVDYGLLGTLLHREHARNARSTA